MDIIEIKSEIQKEAEKNTSGLTIHSSQTFKLKRGIFFVKLGYLKMVLGKLYVNSCLGPRVQKTMNFFLPKTWKEVSLNLYHNVQARKIARFHYSKLKNLGAIPDIAGPVVVLMTSALFKHDAVGNDVIHQYRTLVDAGFKTFLYAEKFDPEFADRVLNVYGLYHWIKRPETTLIYHHSILWENGETILRDSQCKVFLRYHNITPCEFFWPYDMRYFLATQNGRKQTRRMVRTGRIAHYIGASSYNNQELQEYGASRRSVTPLAPFHQIQDFDKASLNPTLSQELSDGKKNILFVGRVVPNKGHKHIIEVIRRYVHLYGRNIRMNIVGGLDEKLSGYYDELKKEINDYGLNDCIFFRQKVSFNDLHTYYAKADIFLLMSEHEGFCVPVLEAQYHNVPIIALDRAAVKEALGEEQIVFQDMDYDLFACAIHTVAENKEYQDYLASKGRENFAKYRIDTLGERLLAILFDRPIS